MKLQIRPVLAVCLVSFFFCLSNRAEGQEATLSATATTLCVGDTPPTITFTGINSTPPYTFTYHINGGATATLVSDATGKATLPGPATDVAGVYTYTVTHVQATSGLGANLNISLTVYVYNLPSAAFTYSSAACSATSFTVVGAPSSEYVYLWDFGDSGDSDTSTERNPQYKYIGPLGTGNYTVKLTVTDTVSHCSASSVQTITAHRLPDAKLGPDTETPFVFSFCAYQANEFTFVNLSSTRDINTNYIFDWGDGTPPTSMAAFTGPVSHTYPPGLYTLLYTVEADGCSNTQEYKVFVGSTPSIRVDMPPGLQTICVGESLTFPVYESSQNVVGSTTYTLYFSDDTPPVSWPSAASYTEITHQFDKSSCGYYADNYANAFLMKVEVSNYCGSAAGNVYPIYVSSPPDAKFILPNAMVCTNTPFCMHSTTEGAEITNTYGSNALCMTNPKVLWTIESPPGGTYTLSSGSMGSDNGFPEDPNYWSTGSESICPLFTAPGTYQISLTSRNRCGADTAYQSVCVEEPIDPVFTLSAHEACVPASIEASASFTESVLRSCSSVTYNWAVTYAAGNCGSASSYNFLDGSGSTPEPTIAFYTPGSYQIRLSTNNLCDAQTSTPQIVIIKDRPKITLQAQNRCETPPETTVPMSATVDACGGGSLTYEWMFPGGVPATSDEVAPVVVYGTSGTKTVELTVANACGATTAPTTVVLNTAPVVNSVANAVYCHGDVTAPIAFSADNPAATFSWTNSLPSIGLAPSGNGPIVPFTATNSALSPVTATLTVTPSVGGCPGTPTTFTITVYPTCNVSFSLPPQQICSGDSTVEVTLNSTTQDVVLSWMTMSPPPGLSGFATDGAATIPAQELINATDAPLTVTYRATAVLPDGTGVACPSSVDYTVVVLPRPSLGAQADTVCSGTAFSIVPVGLVPVGTKYSWPAPDVDAGITGASASGSHEASLTGLLTNTTNTLQSATYTLTPVAEGCEGATFTVVVTVEPKPFIETQKDTICSGASFVVAPVDGGNNIIPSGLTYRWAAPVSTPPGAITGGSAADQQPTISQTLLNTTPDDAVLTYTVYPVSANQCEGAPFTVEITVNAAPGGVVTGGRAVCLDSPEPVLTFTGNSGTAPYTFFYSLDGGAETPLTSVGAAATLSAPTTATGTYVYTLVRVTDATANACTEAQTSSDTVTVAPLPVIDLPMSVWEICAGSGIDTLAVGYTGGAGEPSYQWYRHTLNATSGGTPVAGATASTYAPPVADFAAPGVFYYYVVIDFAGSGCEALAGMVAEATVAPVPAVATQPVALQTVCRSTDADTLTVAITGGISTPYGYQWYDDVGPVAGATAATFAPPTDVAGTYSYYCRMTQSAGCEATSDAAVVKVVDAAEITLQPQPYSTCRNPETPPALSFEYGGGVGTVSYQWYQNDTQQYDGATAIAGAVSSTYYPPYSDYGTTYYYCEVTFTGYRCDGARTELTPIAVLSPPVVLDTVLTDVLCHGATTGAIDLAVESATPVVYAWTGANGFTTNSQNLHNVPAGSYSVTVTNDDCPVTLDFTLTQPDTILFEVATTPIVCYGGNNATVDITVLSGGVAPYEALWSNFTTGFHKENVAAGTYTITIQDANGCTVATTIYFAEPPLFGMTPEVRQMSCYGANDASIKLNFEGGVAPISFAWDDNPDAGTERVLLAAGTYTVRISDAQPCSLTRTFVIIEPLLLYLSADVHHALDCQNPNSGGIDVTVNGGTPPYRFAWSNGATTEDLSGVAPNTYLVDVTDEYGCETSSIYTVQRPQPMALTIDTVPSFDCIARQATQVVTASATGGMPPYSYTWSEGTPSGAYGETAEIYRNGMVLLTVTDQRGCTATKVFDVTLSQYGTVSRMVDCYERIYEFDATLFQEHPNDIYTWDFGDGTTASGKRQTHRYARAGTYPVTLTVTNQRCTYSFPSTVQVAGNPYITIEPAPMFCPGDSLLVTASGAQSYLWDNGHTGPSLMITTEGLYSVRGSMENGCYTDTSFTAGLYSLYGYKIQTDRSEITNADPSIYVWTDDTPGAFYTWDFGDGTGEQPGNYLRHFYPDVTSDAQFRICLSVVNPDGCREEDCTLIHANNVLFPNTFSPNGDGVNDVFMSGWKMEVYNRNGVLFYKGSEGWDGTYNGRPVANDTYFYCIFDGTTEGARKNCNYVTVVR